MDKKKLEKGILEHIKNKSGHSLYTARDFKAGVKWAEKEMSWKEGRGYLKGDVDTYKDFRKKVAELKKRIDDYFSFLIYCEGQESDNAVKRRDIAKIINKVFGE